ncbi:hypothetical protein CK203_035387 [Vitis vinifera]|uniref:Uncharacterized protein n=1 Tax=Vitis vinifera TaxID=29760 RepID=A0A438I3Q6_VITVI|nr:hypothetical protein CK203_035387 [Vitis vinifera]
MSRTSRNFSATRTTNIVAHPNPNHVKMFLKGKGKLSHKIALVPNEDEDDPKFSAWDEAEEGRRIMMLNVPTVLH